MRLAGYSRSWHCPCGRYTCPPSPAIWPPVDQGKTIVLTTNYLEEAEELCDWLAILDHGTVLAVDTPARLRQRFGHQLIKGKRSSSPRTTLKKLRSYATGWLFSIMALSLRSIHLPAFASDLATR